MRDGVHDGSIVKCIWAWIGVDASGEPVCEILHVWLVTVVNVLVVRNLGVRRIMITGATY